MPKMEIEWTTAGEDPTGIYAAPLPPDYDKGVSVSGGWHPPPVPGEPVTIPVGGVWEGPAWEIQYNYENSTYVSIEAGRVSHGDDLPCPHSVDLHEDPPKVYPADERSRSYPVTEITTRWTVPRVVVATNEGGYATTGVCLDCILDWAKENPA